MCVHETWNLSSVYFEASTVLILASLFTHLMVLHFGRVANFRLCFICGDGCVLKANAHVSHGLLTTSFEYLMNQVAIYL